MDKAMSKPKGGRGIRALKPTMMRRIPEGIEQTVVWLSDEFREGRWDGTKETLPMLISGFNFESKNPISESIKEIIKRADNHETGYTTKSFSRGLKDLKRLLEN